MEQFDMQLNFCFISHVNDVYKTLLLRCTFSCCSFHKLRILHKPLEDENCSLLYSKKSEIGHYILFSQ